MQAIEKPSVPIQTVTIPIVNTLTTPITAQQIQLPEPEPILQEEPKLPEIQVPIKKYYGRKRENQTSSDGEMSLDDEDSADLAM